MMTNITNLSTLLSSEQYQIFESETLLNIQYHIINTDKDIDAMIECNDMGLFGCTHGEFIECWRDFLNTLNVFDPIFEDIEDMEKFDITQEVYNSIEEEINKCEEYHIDHFTYNDII